MFVAEKNVIKNENDRRKTGKKEMKPNKFQDNLRYLKKLKLCLDNYKESRAESKSSAVVDKEVYSMKEDKYIKIVLDALERKYKRFAYTFAEMKLDQFISDCETNKKTSVDFESLEQAYKQYEQLKIPFVSNLVNCDDTSVEIGDKNSDDASESDNNPIEVNSDTMFDGISCIVPTVNIVCEPKKQFLTGGGSRIPNCFAMDEESKKNCVYEAIDLNQVEEEELIAPNYPFLLHEIQKTTQAESKPKKLTTYSRIKGTPIIPPLKCNRPTSEFSTSFFSISENTLSTSTPSGEQKKFNSIVDLTSSRDQPKFIYDVEEEFCVERHFNEHVNQLNDISEEAQKVFLKLIPML